MEAYVEDLYNRTDGLFVHRERMLKDFVDIVSVDSPSLKERDMSVLLRQKLESIGLAVYEDGAAAAAGGECGNLIAALQGEAGLPAVALLAHMDTVGPCANKRCVIEGDIVRSDGKTILGGDNAAGILAALEIARRAKDDGVRHGGILIIFTIAEEIGLLGAKYLDQALVKSALGKDEFPGYCYVFDSGGAPGTVVSGAPSHTDLIISVRGAAAHAGIEPEKGVNAIAVLSEAIAHMPLGRIDGETTANIGIIRGGGARNVVCGDAAAEGEARSHDKSKLARQVAAMKQCVDDACARAGATYDFEEITSYNVFSLSEDEPVMKALFKAARVRGYELTPSQTGGGSDANILNAIGVPAANLPVGMYDVHSTAEYSNLRETDETAELIVEALRQIAAGV